MTDPRLRKKARIFSLPLTNEKARFGGLFYTALNNKERGIAAALSGGEEHPCLSAISPGPAEGYTRNRSTENRRPNSLAD